MLFVEHQCSELLNHFTDSELHHHTRILNFTDAVEECLQTVNAGWIVIKFLTEVSDILGDGLELTKTELSDDTSILLEPCLCLVLECLDDRVEYFCEKESCELLWLIFVQFHLVFVVCHLHFQEVQRNWWRFVLEFVNHQLLLMVPERFLLSHLVLLLKMSCSVCSLLDTKTN